MGSIPSESTPAPSRPGLLPTRRGRTRGLLHGQSPTYPLFLPLWSGPMTAPRFLLVCLLSVFHHTSFITPGQNSGSSSRHRRSERPTCGHAFPRYLSPPPECLLRLENFRQALHSLIPPIGMGRH